MAKVTNSSKRAAQSKAGAAKAAKKTTSSGRGAGKTPTVDSRLQRIKTSTAKVSESGKGVKSGSAKVTGGSPKPSAFKGQGIIGERTIKPSTGAPKPQFKSPTISSPVDAGGKAAKALTKPSSIPKKAPASIKSVGTQMLKGIGKRVGLVGVAMEGIQSRNTGDGTMKGKPTSGPQGPKNPDQGKSKSQSFDKAFAAARGAGKAMFSWNGKTYTTKKK
jgi:hypothetical protein